MPDSLSEDNVRIEGGRRIRGIRAAYVRIERSGDPVEVNDCLRISLNKRGDFSTYLLCLVEAAPPAAAGARAPSGGWADDDGPRRRIR